jgi:putative ABC transport system ATP-binding protein
LSNIEFDTEGFVPDIGVPVIDMRDVTKTYKTASGSFTSLRNISLRVQAGDFLAVVGRSGSGKSTLLNMITGIDRPTSGEVHVAGAAVHRLGQQALASWRGLNVGVVFQFFQLLPTLTVAENVMLPMDFCATCPAKERRQRALALLDRFGIAEQADKLPSALSGGQQQRAAIARALANDPPLLVADEPTGNLDSRTAVDVLELFAAVAASGTTVVMVTHGQEAKSYTTSTVELVDGAVAAHA